MGIVEQFFEESGLTQNQLANLSGVQASHLKMIREKDTKKPGRDKLIRVALALGLDINGINSVLKEYKEQSLSKDDVYHFYTAINKRKLHAGPNYAHTGDINQYINLIKMEKNAREFKVVAGHIPHFFWDIEVMEKITDPANERSNEVFIEIRNAIYTRRKEFFEEYLKKHKFDILICKDCLENFFERIVFILKTPDSIQKQFEKFFDYICHENFNLKLLRICNRMDMAITRTVEGNFVYIGGRLMEHYKQTPDTIGGIIFKNKKLYEGLSFEYDRLEKHALEGISDKGKLVGYLIEMIGKKGADIDYTCG